ncbi:MJ0042-type zinc finger domain-containing protein, partial [Pseudoduganella sp. RAF53_2]
MALATKCPHCNTVFRVAADQLKLRGGIVRCGACNEVFDGNAALVEPAAKPTPVIPEVVVTPASAAADYIHGEPLDFDLDALDTDEPLIQSDEDLAASTASVDELLSGIELDFDDEPPAAAPDAGREPATPPAEQSPAPAAKRWLATSAPPAAPFSATAAPERELVEAEDAAPPAPKATRDTAPEPASEPESEPVWQPAASEPEQRAEAWSAHELAREPDVASEPEHELAHDSEGTPEPEPTAEGALEPEPAADDAAPEPHQPHAADAESPAADVDAAFEAEPRAKPDLPAAESAYEAELPEAPSLADAHGRIEPSFDTPQEHIVAAALDDLHH